MCSENYKLFTHFIEIFLSFISKNHGWNYQKKKTQKPIRRLHSNFCALAYRYRYGTSSMWNEVKPKIKFKNAKWELCKTDDSFKLGSFVVKLWSQRFEIQIQTLMLSMRMTHQFEDWTNKLVYWNPTPFFLLLQEIPSLMMPSLVVSFISFFLLAFLSSLFWFTAFEDRRRLMVIVFVCFCIAGTLKLFHFVFF